MYDIDTSEIILDCKKIKSITKFYDEISKRFDTPDYFGRNLDALYDILCEMSEIKIVLRNTGKLKKNLNEYADSIITVFKDAAVENKKLILEIEE